MCEFPPLAYLSVPQLPSAVSDVTQEIYSNSGKLRLLGHGKSIRLAAESDKIAADIIPRAVIFKSFGFSRLRSALVAARHRKSVLEYNDRQ